jgi:hypothetical protein
MFPENEPPAPGDIRVQGRHTTKADGNLAYEYDGYCFPIDDRFLWRARVYRDGKLRGMLYGRLGQDQAAAIQNSLTAAIAAKIEELREGH